MSDTEKNRYLIEKEIDTLFLINSIVAERLKKYLKGEPNGAMIGQFTGKIYDKHFS